MSSSYVSHQCPNEKCRRILSFNVCKTSLSNLRNCCMCGKRLNVSIRRVVSKHIHQGVDYVLDTSKIRMLRVPNVNNRKAISILNKST